MAPKLATAARAEFSNRECARLFKTKLKNIAHVNCSSINTTLKLVWANFVRSSGAGSPYTVMMIN